MRKLLLLIFIFLGFLFNLQAQHYKKDGTPDKRYKENRSYHYSPLSHSSHSSHNKKKRSETARYQFMKQTGYPHGRKGYVIDHIIPLKKGGCDCPSNMQWQTIDAAKTKDKWE